MFDSEDPDLFKVRYSKNEKVNVDKMIKELEAAKKALEKRWEPYGGENVFNNSISGDDGDDSMTRLGTKMARALLLGDVFTFGFTGSSNTAGHQNMYYNTYPIQLQSMMGNLVKKVGYKGAAFRSKNNAWGGNINTKTEAWCVSGMTGDDADIVIWESMMNDGGRPDKRVLEVHMRNALLQKKRPVYHFVHWGMCKADSFSKSKLKFGFADHYRDAGAGTMKI